MKREPMNFGQLLEQLQSLTAEQLAQPVILLQEGPHINVHEFVAFDEDQINPSGDGIEPVSAYDNDPYFDMSDEPVVLKKGTPVLINSD